MLAFISFLLVCIGSINWFCIGILQYDFVAGIFGSQSNIFSRLIYTLVGIASIIVIGNLIKNKGKFVVSFKKANKEYDAYMKDMEEKNRQKVLAKVESGEDFGNFNKEKNDTLCQCSSSNNGNCNCDKDDHGKCDCQKNTSSEKTDSTDKPHSKE